MAEAVAAAAEQALDEAAAGAEETVKIICLGDSAVGKSKCVAARARRRPAGSPWGREGRGSSVPRPNGRVVCFRRLLERFLLDGLYPSAAPPAFQGRCPEQVAARGGAAGAGGRRAAGSGCRPGTGGRCSVVVRAPPSAP